tara:strand:- start:20043 stop:20852 length:810 start_codon:yes stop_codon:yes gene_type:complete
MIKRNFIMSLKRNRELIELFVKRDINSKYKGSILGILWTLINPIIMLTVYTIIFSQVFTIKWGNIGGRTNSLEFAINLFAGLIVFNIFAETAARSSQLISNNPNYIKKIKFPIEILGVMVTGTAFIQAAISLIILLTVNYYEYGVISHSIIVIPVIWGSYSLKILGMVWILSTIGVFIRDLNQIVNALISILMFMSPIFYPIEILPDNLKGIIGLNPLVLTIEHTRNIITKNYAPRIEDIIWELAISILWCEISYRILKRSHLKFADRL